MSNNTTRPEPVAYYTTDAEGSPTMLWWPTDLVEARMYCEDDTEPVPLYASLAPVAPAGLRDAAQSALESLEGFLRFMAVMNDGPDASDKLLAEDHAEGAFLRAVEVVPILRAALAVDAAPAPVAPAVAGDLTEPKNGAAWRVEWWNESARLMLPDGSTLDSFQSYKNGTLMFTIKRAPRQESGAA